MSRLLPAAAFAFLVVALVLVFTTNRKPGGVFNPDPGPTSTTAPGGDASIDPGDSSPAPPVPVSSKDPRLARYSDGSVEYLASLETSRSLHKGADPATDLVLIGDLLAGYRQFFKANPVGSENAEITSQLLGNNKMRLRFLDLKTTPLDSSGALVDRWGTPYFFHPLSAQVMGIRSAGPDQELWTEDDLESDVGEIEKALQLQSSN